MSFYFSDESSFAYSTSDCSESNIDFGENASASFDPSTMAFNGAGFEYTTLNPASDVLSMPHYPAFECDNLATYFPLPFSEPLTRQWEDTSSIATSSSSTSPATAANPTFGLDIPGPSFPSPALEPAALLCGDTSSALASSSSSPSHAPIFPHDRELDCSSSNTLKRRFSTPASDDEGAMPPPPKAPRLPKVDRHPETGRRRIWCDLCSDFYAYRKGDLTRHMESKRHKAPSHVCHKCGKKFTRVDALERHTKANKCFQKRKAGGKKAS